MKSSHSRLHFRGNISGRIFSWGQASTSEFNWKNYLMLTGICSRRVEKANKIAKFWRKGSISYKMCCRLKIDPAVRSTSISTIASTIKPYATATFWHNASSKLYGKMHNQNSKHHKHHNNKNNRSQNNLHSYLVHCGTSVRCWTVEAVSFCSTSSETTSKCGLKENW